jgi:hypothetical protein
MACGDALGAGYGWRPLPGVRGARHNASFFAAACGVDAGVAVLVVAAAGLAVVAPQWTRLRTRQLKARR